MISGAHKLRTAPSLRTTLTSSRATSWRSATSSLPVRTASVDLLHRHLKGVGLFHFNSAPDTREVIPDFLSKCYLKETQHLTQLPINNSSIHDFNINYRNYNRGRDIIDNNSVNNNYNVNGSSVHKL